MRFTLPNFTSIKPLPAGSYKGILEGIHEPRKVSKQDGSVMYITEFTFHLPPQENVDAGRKFNTSVFDNEVPEKVFRTLSGMGAVFEDDGTADLTGLLNREYGIDVAQSEDGSKNFCNRIVPIE